MLQTFTFTGAGRIINAAATFIRYESGSAAGADDAIRIRADGQDLGTYEPGDSIELPIQVSTWEIAPASPLCTGVVRVGIGRVSSARLVGQVEVIDAGKARVMADVEYTHSLTVGPAAAGNFCSGEVFNASAKLGVAIKSLQISTDTTATFSITATGAQMVAQVSQGFNSKRVGAGGTRTVAANVVRNSAGNLVAPDSTVNLLANVAAVATPREFVNGGTPYVLSPGTGLRISCQVADRPLLALFSVELFPW